MIETSLSLASKALYIVLQISLPPIIVAAVVGLLVSLFQAITQLQEQTLSFGIKLVAISATIFLISRWLASGLYLYAEEIFSKFYLMVG